MPEEGPVVAASLGEPDKAGHQLGCVHHHVRLYAALAPAVAHGPARNLEYVPEEADNSGVNDVEPIYDLNAGPAVRKNMAISVEQPHVDVTEHGTGTLPVAVRNGRASGGTGHAQVHEPALTGQKSCGELTDGRCTAEGAVEHGDKVLPCVELLVVSVCNVCGNGALNN